MRTTAWLILAVAAVVSVSSARADRIQNRWKSDQFLHIEHGKIEAGTVLPDWLSAQWSIETVRPGNPAVRIRNRWKPDQYLHVESGALEAGPAPPEWISAMWTLEPAGGSYVRIRSVWRNNFYIHIEQGQVAAGEIMPDWLSAQWTVVADGGAGGQASKKITIVNKDETCPVPKPDGTFDFALVSAKCPAGKHVTGGGCGSYEKRTTIFSSTATAAGDAWYCSIRCYGLQAKVFAQALCSD